MSEPRYTTREEAKQNITSAQDQIRQRRQQIKALKEELRKWQEYLKKQRYQYTLLAKPAVAKQ